MNTQHILKGARCVLVATFVALAEQLFDFAPAARGYELSRQYRAVASAARDNRTRKV